MARKSAKNKSAKPLPEKTVSKPFLSERKQDYLFIGIIFALLLFTLKPLVVDRLSPQGVDVVAAKGKSNQFVEWNKENSDKALWNPAIFGGMPQYYDYSPVAFSVDNILDWFTRFTGGVFIYYLIATIGMYILLRYLKFSPIIAFTATAMFIFIPHYKSLWVTGHFRKFRALMYLPWILLAFQYFVKHKNILGAALFAIAFGIQIRTQHYQIIFYTGLMIFSIGVYPFLQMLFQKKFGAFSKSTALLAGSLTLAILMAAQPLFLAKEYLPYSKRGKTTISLKNPTPVTENVKNDGVKIDYATQWSTHPTEAFTWIIPHFYGGMSQEKYTGKNAPRLSGRAIPSYWGFMPFTQSFEYMGVLTLLLAVTGFWFFRKNPFIRGLAIFALFLTLLSFGRHFISFYSLFFEYIPFFNKFRAPMMSVTMLFFIFSIFAAYGISYLYNLAKEKTELKPANPLSYITGAFFVLGIVLWLASTGFSFTAPGDSQYQPQVIEMFKSARAEMFNGDMIRYFIIVVAFGGLVFAFLKKKISFMVLTAAFALITLTDLLNIQSKVETNFINRQKLEQQYFRKTATDQFLLADKETFRILPAGKSFTSNRDGYYHQTIGGYSPTKMFTIEELIENNIFNGWDKAFPINSNVLQTLNVKYVLLPQQISHPDYQLVHQDRASGQFTYRYKNYLPRGFFVDEAKVIKDAYKRLEYMNTPQFKPASTALLETEPPVKITAADSVSSRLTHFSPNRVTFETYNSQQALFVISELYYPPGWHIYIDDKEVEHIYKTNHAIQSIIVPAGNHTITVAFEPASYFENIRIASFSVSLLYISIAVSLFMMFRKSKKVTAG